MKKFILPVTIGSVLIMTGFKSSSTFYKRFKNAVGMTPHQFRERVQKLNKPPLA